MGEVEGRRADGASQLVLRQAGVPIKQLYLSFSFYILGSRGINNLPSVTQLVEGRSRI